MRTKISSSRGLSVFSLITRDLALLFLVDLMMSLGMNLTDSLRSLYIESLGATVLQISLVVSATGMAGTLMRVPSGLFSDNYGRKRIIIASILMAASPPFLYTLSRSWDQLIPWGLVYSSAFALYMPSRMALLADLTPVEHRTKVYSILGLAWPLGSILGPALAGVIQVTQGWAPVFYLASAVYVICLVPGLLLPKPRLDPEAGEEVRIDRPNQGASLGLDFVRPISAFIVLHLLMGLAVGATNSITPIYLSSRFSASTGEVGLFTSVGFGVTTLLAQIPGGTLADRFGRKRFMAACLALEPFLFLVWTTIDQILPLLLVQMAINALWSMTWPATMSLLMEHAPGPRRGTISGFVQMGMMLGFTVGPAVGGFLWETMGTSFPYYSSAVFFALCLPIVRLINSKKVPQHRR